MRVLLVDDHQMFCQGLRSLLEREPDIDVVGEAGDGRTAVRLVQDLSPDLVVMDVSMPEMNGAEATRQIKARTPGVKVIALSMFEDKHYVFDMLSAGASAYVVKSGAYTELVYAMQQVCSGRGYLSPRVAGYLIEDVARMRTSLGATRLSVLTTREREVLQLLAEGRPVRVIAKQLHLSAKTVDTHRRNIMTKLDIYSVAELTKLAVSEGLTSLSLGSNDKNDVG
jgi:DNA-binding NarL/FixJ family response regulator